jgi:hypothetical protein
VTPPAPQPVFMVRCTASGCDWSVQSNVAKRLGQFWRWHAAWHRAEAKALSFFEKNRNAIPVTTPVEKGPA